ncbi:hypothetical protein GTA08_BOTSDO02728 [Neofusicoccum parvum]|nr:hypothetical protein GTA08_BOTSDO02728 [Neofusicoccum parvum]
MCASANKCITCADSWPYEGPRPALASQPRGGGSPAKDLDPRDLPLRCAFSARLPARILRAASQTRARQSLPHYNTATDRPPAATARVAVAMFSPAHAAVLSCFSRNILLLSLIVDDRHGDSQHAAWSLYYHLFLDGGCLALLQAQAKKLLEASPSLDRWHQGPYGRLLRLCDSVTLAQVRDVWASYVNAGARPPKAAFERARQAKEAHGRGGNVLTAARSAAPFTLDAASDAPLLFEQYRDRGITAGPDDTANPDLPNPMFSGEMDDLTLHYATDPTLGFHLATAYAPLAASSPLNPNLAKAHGPEPAVKAARQQFAAWCSAFRQCSAHFTLRFFVGEALTLCHVLQQKLTAGDESWAQWSRGPYMPDPLILDGDDYRSGQALLAFNVIDTSNLVDHFGSINLLLACLPT